MVQDLVVGEPEDAEAGGAEPSVTHAVTAGASAMHRAIDFYDQRRLDAEEIDDEGAQWVLSAKLVAELPPTQQSPEHTFGRRHRAPQGSGAIG
jgi:hypothetical protein